MGELESELALKGVIISSLAKWPRAGLPGLAAFIESRNLFMSKALLRLKLEAVASPIATTALSRLCWPAAYGRSPQGASPRPLKSLPATTGIITLNNEQLQHINQCLRYLTTATSTTGLYSPGHPHVLRLCQQAHAELLRGMNGMEELSLLRVDDQLAIDRQPLARTLYTERLALLLKRRGVGHLKFINGIEFDELMALSAGLVSSEREIQSSRHLRLGQVEVRHSWRQCRISVCRRRRLLGFSA